MATRDRSTSEGDEMKREAGPDGLASRLSRRRFLVGAAGVGGLAVVGGVAACSPAAPGQASGTPAASTAPGSAAASASAGESAAASPSASASSSATKGGNFRLGVTGGGSKDIIDGQHIVTKPDQARLVATFEALLGYDAEYKLTNDGLAEEVVADKADQWTIRLREGIEFHDGKTVGADDVIYSLTRILDPDEGLFGGAGLASIDPKNMKKVDERTVQLNLLRPDSTIPDQLAQYYNGIVPVEYTRAGKQNGTGPFKVESFTPGEQSVHVRNENYWRPDQPSFDKVTVLDFPDPSAQVNALLAGQVDAITDIPFAQIDVAKAQGGLSILESEGGGWLPLCMAIDMEPFNDVRVRQAFRLMVNRQQFVDQVLSGHGRIANDLFGPFDASYNSALPQRQQDFEMAKTLLKEAGKEGLVVDLHTTDGAAGMVDLAKVFAEQAKGAGVTVNVKIDPNYYGDQYLKLPFSVDFWGTRTYLAQVTAGSLSTSPFNETHWPPKDSNYQELFEQALAEVDLAKRTEIIHQMQQLEYDQGGYIITFFNNLVDAYSDKVQGFQTSRATLNLDTYGHGFRTISFV